MLQTITITAGKIRLYQNFFIILSRTLPFNGKEETHPWRYIDDPKADKNWDYCDPDFTVEKCAAPMGEDVVEKEGSGNNNEGSGDDAVVDECIWFDFESHRDFTP